MFIASPKFLINIITKPDVADHLVPNISKFEIVYYIREDLKGGRPGDSEEKDITKVQLMCGRNKLNEIMGYLIEYYVKGYGAVVYYEEVHVPI